MQNIVQPETKVSMSGMILLVVVGCIATIISWGSLPQEMVIGWDAAGEARQTADRTVGGFALPAGGGVIIILWRLLPSIDPLGKNIEGFRGWYNGLFVFLVALLTAIHLTVIAENLGYAVPITSIVFVLVGLLILYTGGVLQAAEPNWFVGIRTPWTLSSELVWDRTHDLAGTLFIFAGIAIVALALVQILVGEMVAIEYLLIGIILVVVLVPILYSYILYQQLEDHTPPISR